MCARRADDEGAEFGNTKKTGRVSDWKPVRDGRGSALVDISRDDAAGNDTSIHGGAYK